MKNLILVVLILGASAISEAQVPFTNLDAIGAAVGLTPYYVKTPVKTVKIAVFDHGFTGYQNEVGKTLPANTVYHPGPLAAPDSAATPHGTVMAQVVTNLMTNSGKAPALAPELHLYNVFGFSNFKAAIDDAIAQKVDIILHSEVWEYGSNFDGDGFFNAQVSRATAAGIIWVNAAGNFARTTFNSAIVDGPDHWVNLPDPNSSLAFQCTDQGNAAHSCALRLVLSWNDFKNDINQGTNKDLDVFVYDSTMKLVTSSQLRQTSGAQGQQPDFSLYPREIVEGQIQPGVYFIKVQDHSQNFAATDHLRIALSGDFITLNRYDPNESLLNPADDASVVTVGASDSELSSVSFKLGKPEITAPSALVMNDGSQYRGSSNSAAFVAAGFGILRSLFPNLQRQDLLSLTSNPQNAMVIAGKPSSQLGFTGTGPGGCFELAADAPLKQWPSYFYDGLEVQTTQGEKLITRFDPNVVQETTTLPPFQLPADLDVCGISTPRIYGSGTVGMMQPFHLPQVY